MLILKTFITVSEFIGQQELIWMSEMTNVQNKFIKVSLWKRLINDFKLLFSLIKDYWKGAYRDVSIWSILVFSFAIIYILSPIDIIPDFTLGLGQIDDAAVLLLCLYFLEKDLYKYKEWKKKMTASSKSSGKG